MTDEGRKMLPEHKVVGTRTKVDEFIEVCGVSVGYVRCTTFAGVGKEMWFWAASPDPLNEKVVLLSDEPDDGIAESREDAIRQLLHRTRLHWAAA